MTEPRRLLDKTLSEAAFQAQIIALAQMCGWKVVHFRPARTEKGWRTAIEGDKGWPDLVLAKPGHCLYLWEIKSEAGRVTPDEQAWLDVMEQLVNVDARVVRPSDWPFVESTLKGEMANGS